MATRHRELRKKVEYLPAASLALLSYEQVSPVRYNCLRLSTTVKSLIFKFSSFDSFVKPLSDLEFIWATWALSYSNKSDRSLAFAWDLL